MTGAIGDRVAASDADNDVRLYSLGTKLATLLRRLLNGKTVLARLRLMIGRARSV